MSARRYRVQLDVSRVISHERAHINTLQTRKSRLNSRLKRTRQQLIGFLKHTRKIIVMFSRVVIRVFSVVEIPILHSSLYNKIVYYFDFNSSTVKLRFSTLKTSPGSSHFLSKVPLRVYSYVII